MSSTERGGAFLSSPQLDADNALTSLNTPCYCTPLCACISRSLCLKCSSLSYSSVKSIHEKGGRTNTSLKLSLLFCNPQSLCSTTSLVCCDICIALLSPSSIKKFLQDWTSVFLILFLISSTQQNIWHVADNKW